MLNRIMRLGACLIACAGSATTLSACATMTRGTTHQFEVASEPPGAQVSTSHGFECAATPCTFRMPRNQAFVATISKEGYVTQTHQVTTAISGGGATAMAGNILIGGLIGAGVDATSGALNDLTPPALSVVLAPESPSSSGDE